MKVTRAILATSVVALLAATSASAANLTWDITPGTVGAGDSAVTGGTGNWDVLATLGNWTADSGATNVAWVNANLDTATFSGAPGGVVTLTTGITVGGIVFEGPGYSITGNTLTLGATTNTITTNAFDGAITSILAGTTGFTKDGSAILTLNGANTVGGQITISAGTLKAGNAAALGAAGAGNETIVQNGGTLDVNGQALTVTEIIKIAGTGATGTGALVNNGAAQQNALNRVDLTADATIGGTARFDIRAGTAPLLDLAGFTLTKAGANQFSVVAGTITSGNLAINAGIFSIETTTVVQGTGTITVGSGGTLGLYGNTTTSFTRDIVVNGGSISNLGLDGGVNSNIVLGDATFSTFTGTATTTLNGIISGSGNLNKTGAGTFVLAGNNTYTGTTSVSGGILRTTTTAALPGYNTTGKVSVLGGGTLAVTVGGAGNWVAGDVNTLLANASFSVGSALGIDTGGGAFNLANNLSGDLGLTKLGANTLTLSGTNTYLGTTTISGGTLLLAAGTGHLPTGGNVTFTGNSTLDLAGSTQAIGTLAVNGVTTGTIANGTVRTASITFDAGAGNSTLAGGTLDLNGGATTINATAAGIVTARDRVLSSIIAGTGSLSIAANGDLTDGGGGGNSDFALTGANTFTGNVAITAGLVTASSNFGNAANGITLQGGGLVHNAGTAVNFTRNITLGTGEGVFRVYGSGNLTVTNGITGTGNLRKTDLGTMTFGGTNTYTGTTVVGSGTLVVPAGASLTGTSGIRIQTAGTFTNQGTVTITGTGVNDDAGAGYSLAVLNGQTFNQSGTLSIVNFGANGTTNISGGTMNVSGLFYTGEQTAATVRTINQTGGVLNLTTPTANAIRLSHWNGGAFTYNLTGGTVDASGSGSSFNVGWDGPATVIVGGSAGLATLKVRALQLDANGDTTTYSDTMTLSTNGVAEIGTGGTAGASANDKIILNGGTLRAVAVSTWNAQISANNATTSALDVGTGNTATQAGLITNAGTGSINKTGNGTLILSGAGNTFASTFNANAGTTSISTTGTFTGTPTFNAASGGILSVSHATAAFTAAATVNLNNGGTLTGTGVLGATSNTVVNAGGAIAPGANALQNTIGTLTVGNLSGTGGELRLDLNATTTTTGGATNDLVAATGATVNLTGVTVLPRFAASPTSGNTYTIITSASAPTGAATLSALASGANSSLAFTLGTVGNNTTLNVTGAARNLVWNGDGTANAWDLNTASNFQVTTANDSTFKSYDILTFNDTSTNKTVNLTGQLMTLGVTVNNTAGNDYTFVGNGSVIGGALTKQGAGKLVVTNENTFGGSTISAGTLQIGNGGTTGSIGAAAITNNGVLNFNRNDSVIYAGVISGTGSLVKDGPGTLSLTAQNTFTGGTIVNGGTLDLAAGGGGSGVVRGTVTMNTGTTLRLSTGDATGFNLGGQISTLNLNNATMFVAVTNNQTIAGCAINLTGSTISGVIGSNIDLFNNGSNISTLASANSSLINLPTMNLRQNDTQFNIADGAAPVDLLITSNLGNGNTGNHNLLKMGPGLLQLAGTNGYTGATLVNAGTLLVTGSIATSASTINGVGAVLTGTGTIGAATLTSGTLTAGNGGIGTLNTGNLSLNGGTALFELGASTSDTLNTTGTVTFGGNVELSLSFSTDLATGTSFTLVNNDGTDAFAFTLGGFAVGGVPITPGVDFGYTSGAFSETFQLSYVGGSGNDAVLTVVPEPGTTLALLGGLGVLLTAGRRRRR